MVDFFSEFRAPLLRMAPHFYQLLATNSIGVYNVLFSLSNSRLVSSIIATMLYRLIRKKLHEYMRAYQPHAVISVHPLYMSDILAKARRECHSGYGVVTMVTDPVSPHASWACPAVDRCFVPTAHAGAVMEAYGVPRKVIRNTGFPIRRKFLESRTKESRELRRELGLAEDRFTVLITGGGNGAGHLEAIAVRVSSDIPSAQIIVLTGYNSALLARIRRRRIDTVTALPFTDLMPLWLAASDVVVTKAGPGTLFEAAAVGRPVIVIEEVGFQERGNARLAEELGFGYGCASEDAVIARLRRLMEIPGRQEPERSLLSGARRAVKETLALVDARMAVGVL
jgi:UDP-N-acetylglucosamine:LPS N-acetylglucosamine transferase